MSQNPFSPAPRTNPSGTRRIQVGSGIGSYPGSRLAFSGIRTTTLTSWAAVPVLVTTKGTRWASRRLYEAPNSTFSRTTSPNFVLRPILAQAGAHTPMRQSLHRAPHALARLLFDVMNE